MLSCKPSCHSLLRYFLDFMASGWPSLVCPEFSPHIQDVFKITCLSLALLVQYWFSPRWNGICSNIRFLITSHQLTYRRKMKIIVIVISTICESLIASHNPESYVLLCRSAKGQCLCLFPSLCEYKGWRLNYTFGTGILLKSFINYFN